MALCVVCVCVVCGWGGMHSELKTQKGRITFFFFSLNFNVFF